MFIYDLRYMYQNLDVLVVGLGKTIEIAVISLLVAVIIGLILVFPRLSGRRLLAIPAAAYIQLYRNTPLLPQIYLLYFGLPMLGITLSAFLCGVLGLAMQHGAFLAEVFRSGIQSVSIRQVEAAKALGMNKRMAMRLIVLPQALVNVLPLVGNQLVWLVQDSSVVSVIAVLELTLTGQILSEKTAAPFAIYIGIGFTYLVLVSLLSMLLRYSEKYLKINY